VKKVLREPCDRGFFCLSILELIEHPEQFWLGM